MGLFLVSIPQRNDHYRIEGVAHSYNNYILSPSNFDSHIFRQFVRYFIGGCIANGVDIGGFLMLHWLGTYYLWATFISGLAGFLSAFLLHKYFVFQKKDNHVQHFVRFALLGLFNIIAVAAVLYMCVEWVGIPEEVSKVIANASQVLWGFLLMKFLVYI